MPHPVDSPRVVNIADLRRLAERRLPRAVFDYIDGGADAELTLRENCRVYDDVILRPRNAVAIPQCDLHVTVLGQRLELPFLLAPVGSSRMSTESTQPPKKPARRPMRLPAAPVKVIPTTETASEILAP